MESILRYVNDTVSVTKSTDFGNFTKEEARRIREKYPDRVPVLVGKSPSSSNAPDIDKHKFLVPMELTLGQFLYVIRKRLSLSPDKALFLFVDGMIPPTGSIMSSIYEDHKDRETEFLFVTYSLESTFG
jgi:GABA(A) receptor-associated protein